MPGTRAVAGSVRVFNALLAARGSRYKTSVVVAALIYR